jgi:hypothetical protein
LRHDGHPTLSRAFGSGLKACLAETPGAGCDAIHR